MTETGVGSGRIGTPKESRLRLEEKEKVAPLSTKTDV